MRVVVIFGVYGIWMHLPVFTFYWNRHRQTDTQRGTDRQTQTDRHTERDRQTYTERQTDRHTDRQTDIQRQTDTPVRERVIFKHTLLVFKALHGLLPPYLADDCQLLADTRRRQLQSSDVATYNLFKRRAK